MAGRHPSPSPAIVIADLRLSGEPIKAIAVVAIQDERFDVGRIM